MKTLLISLTMALTAATVLSGTAEAATHRNWHGAHAYAGSYARAHPYRHRNDDTIGGGYYEHRLDAVRFGSQRWWKIYDEQKGPRG